MSKKAITAKEETAEALHTFIFYGADVFVKQKGNLCAYNADFGNSVTKASLVKWLDENIIEEITITFKPNFDD